MLKLSNSTTLTKQSVQVSAFLNNDNTQQYLKSVLGNNAEKFVTNLVSVVNQNQSLSECTHTSLMSGAIVASTLNLSLNKGFGYAYLVPFKNNKIKDVNGNPTKEAQFQIGYKGYIQLAMRTGQYKKINAVPIYENQFISYNEVYEDLQLNNISGEGKVVGYVAYFQLLNGFEKLIYWDFAKMINHADKFSQAFNKNDYFKLIDGKINNKDLWKYSSFWYKDFNEMANKTMLRQLLSKYGILTEEMQTAYEYDQAVIREGDAHYIENDRSNSDEIIEQEEPLQTQSEALETKEVSFDEL